MQKFKRICPKCNSKNTKKDGKRRGRQSYKCKSCNYVWITKSRKNKANLARKLYYLYTIRKQTYSELSQDYGLSKKTLQTLFDNLNIVSNKKLPIGKVLIDTTYFGDFGLIVFKDTNKNKILYYQIVDRSQ